jgi:hypothetical protein
VALLAVGADLCSHPGGGRKPSCGGECDTREASIARIPEIFQGDPAAEGRCEILGEDDSERGRRRRGGGGGILLSTRG